MSVQAITWAYQQQNISTGAKFLLVTLANYADQDGVSWPGQERLAEDTQSNSRTIRRWTSELTEKNLVSAIHRPGKGGGRLTILYKLEVRQPDTVSGGNRTSTTGQPDTVSSNTKGEPSVRTKAPTVLCENEVSTSPANGCPYKKIVELYHEKLPMLPRIKMLTDHRKTSMRMRWKNELPDLETWGKFFGDVSKSKFLTGKSQPTNGRRPFQADIDFLLKPSNIAKIAEGKYDG